MAQETEAGEMEPVLPGDVVKVEMAAVAVN